MSLSVPLDEIDDCFQGGIPSELCSASREGVPNVTYLSIIHHIDDSHVGLSRQFFNKTIANMEENPRVQAIVTEPTSGRLFRLDLLYERTDLEGPLFERVKARLDAVASFEGLRNVFKLAAVDICRVLACEKVPGDWDENAPRREHAGLDALDEFSVRIAYATDVDELITIALQAFDEIFGWEHSFILMLDESGDKLYTVGSRGYEPSGVGAEVGLGEGVIGIAAQRQRSINIGNMSSDVAYVQAVRESIERSDASTQFELEIPLPGLPSALSQIAAPILGRGKLLGVVCLQSETAARFGAREEAAVNVAARQIGLSLLVLRSSRDLEPMITAEVRPAPPRATGATVQVKHYTVDDSVFADNEYVIKGVAGRILWRLLHTYAEERRVEFTNKEIRLDPYLDLPDIKDNLEARLILLRRRLEERCGFLHIQNTGRGKFRLDVERAFELREIGGVAAQT
jgi:adenylate cyclase